MDMNLDDYIDINNKLTVYLSNFRDGVDLDKVLQLKSLVQKNLSLLNAIYKNSTISLPQKRNRDDSDISSNTIMDAILKLKHKQTKGNKNNCYICKKYFKNSHQAYFNMCFKCGNLNFQKRKYIGDLKDKTAVVTGGRVKIGYYTALKLLKGGCHVVITTRFPEDAYNRYSKTEGFSEWGDRLSIYKLDLMCFDQINSFVQYLNGKFKQIDILINNAAQTIDRPYEFYQKEIKMEMQETEKKDNSLIVRAENSCTPSIMYSYNNLLLADRVENKKITKSLDDYFPENQVDEFGQQIDLRTNNSWDAELEDVSIVECAKVYIINSLAPYILIARLKPLMSRDGCENSWIVNVSSMEGKFGWKNKGSNHPHTNMAKAALNMLTRTCGKHYIKSNIVMYCVDTGWNNSQYPCSYDVTTPLTCEDGAARILDPIYRNLKIHGVFYKDFVITDW